MSGSAAARGRACLLLAGALVACSTTSPRPGDTAGPASATGAPASPRAPAPEASARELAASAAPSPPPGHVGPLARFYDALRALERGERKEHVRILWLGDSHAQADFWTGYIRTALQKRFGSAGPGFVHLGFKEYRHNGIETEIQGAWRMRPKQPSTVERWGDGAFGLGGILHAGYQGSRWAQVTLTEPRLAERKLRIDLCYKPGLPHDAFRVELTGAAQQEIRVSDEAEVGTIRHLELSAQGLARFRVVVRDGRPDFCGLVIETDPSEHPGVVLDNLGINGARYGTALAWNEEAWAREVERRAPELFVFEYGGNEASDGVIKPAEYKAQASELIARAKRIRPEASCLVIGPADRADAEAKIPPIVAALEQAASEGGCMFWDTYTVMGGKGSLRKWRDDERAAEDGVHLKPKGYEQLGALLLADLMRGYSR